MADLFAQSARHALIPGVSRGIGARFALALASAGHAISINFRSNRDAAESVAESVCANGGNLTGRCLRPPKHPQLISAAEAEFGTTGVLVNNAGVGEHRAVAENSMQDFDRTFALNVRATFALTETVLPSMRRSASAG